MPALIVSTVRLAIVLALASAGVAFAADQAAPTPRVFSADPQVLAANKAALAAGNADLQPALKHVLDEADKRLDQKPRSVMDKEVVPPSGDKHDFMSQAPYFWKDTNSPDGKYIRRDGVRNPEIAKISDAGAFGAICSTTHTLGLAWYFTGDEKYAAKATELLRVWFLNPATRMNPNLNYGQGIPGETEGRPTGLIGARGLADLVDGVGLLAGSKSWTPADQQGMTAWAGDYFKWLTTSKIGLGEDAAGNNHGTFFDVQAVSLALFIGNTDYARAQVLAARQKRIADQIEPDGRLPKELARTLSFNYSVFDLSAEAGLADLARNVGVDLWHYETPDGRGILQAVEFMAPYADPQKHWPYQQIHAPDRNGLGEILERAAAQFPESHLVDDLKFYRPTQLADNPLRLYLKVAPLPATN